MRHPEAAIPTSQQVVKSNGQYAGPNLNGINSKVCVIDVPELNDQL